MKADKSKKYKGIKYLKVEQQFFNNAKKYNRKCSYNNNNTASINNQSSSNECKRIKSFKSSIFNDNMLKTDGEKTTISKNNIYYNKIPKKSIELASNKISPLKIKDKEEMLLNKFNKNNIKPLIHRSDKAFKKLYSSKSLGLGANLKSNKSLYNKSMIKFNDINNNENENKNNLRKDGKIKIYKNEDYIEKKEKNSGKSGFHKLFCCL